MGSTRSRLACCVHIFGQSACNLDDAALRVSQRGPRFSFPGTQPGVFQQNVGGIARSNHAYDVGATGVAHCIPYLRLWVKLFGLRAMVRLDLGEERHHSTATVLSLTFALSFLIGTSFRIRHWWRRCCFYSADTLDPWPVRSSTY